MFRTAGRLSRVKILTDRCGIEQQTHGSTVYYTRDKLINILSRKNTLLQQPRSYTQTRPETAEKAKGYSNFGHKIQKSWPFYQWYYIVVIVAGGICYTTMGMNQKFIKWLNAKVNAASKEVDGEKSEEEQVPEDVELKKTGKEISNRDRRIIAYENRIRGYSNPDKIFRYFATLKVNYKGRWEVYMTPEDFVRAITPGVKQPEGLGLDHYKKYDPQHGKKLDWQIGRDTNSIFYKLGESGLISFSDFIFLLTVLSTPPRNFQIAFKMFDLNGDGDVDKEEFDKVHNIVSAQTTVGNHHRDHKATGGGNRSYGSALRTYFFGANGEKKLTVKQFLDFQAELSKEILRIEFERYNSRYEKVDYISEKDFAHILITYAGYPGEKRSRMINRVRQKFNDEEKGITFEEYLNFWKFLKNVNDVDTALSFYHLAGVSIDQETLVHVAKTVAYVHLSEHLVDVVFTLFDENDDGQLSNKEFISVMKRRAMRGLDKPRDTGFTRLVGAVFTCAISQTTAYFRS